MQSKEMKILQVLPPIIGYRGITTYARTLDQFIDFDVFTTTGFIDDFRSKIDCIIEPYDIIHFHDVWYPAIARMCKNVIFTCHSKKIASLMRGFSEVERIKHTIAISPEVSAELDKSALNNTYIPQPIAHYHFIPQTPPSEKPKTILVFNNDCSPAFLEAFKAGRRRGSKIIIDNRNNIYDTRKLLDKADLVISVGRGALEAASMQKPVYIVGTNYADGCLGDHSYDDYKYCNFSGRTRQRADWSNIVTDIYESYNINGKDLIRKKIIENNDPKTIAKQIKEVYERFSTK
jgi:hypothetical protein